MVRVYSSPSWLSLVPFLVLVFLAAPPLYAQQEREREQQVERTTRDEAERRELETALDELTEEPLQDFEFDYGGWARYSYYKLRDNLQRRTFRVSDLRLWANLVYRNNHQLYMRISNNLTDYNSGDEYFYMEENDYNMARLDVGYYYGDLGKTLSLDLPGKLRLMGGRQYISLGQGLVLDARGDGLMMEYDSEEFNLTGFVIRSIYSEDSYDRSRPDFGYNKYLYSGFEATKSLTEDLEIYAYSLFMEDKNQRAYPQTTQKYAYNARYHGGGFRGQVGTAFDFYGEYTIERGWRYSDGSLERSDIDAFAYDLGTSYSLVESKLRPRLSAQYVVGSGDPDTRVTVDTVQGNQGGTDDDGFFSYGYLNTGFSFFPLVSNLEMVRFGLDIMPFHGHETMGDLEMGFNYFNYRKHNAKGGISDRGLDTSQNVSWLGYETDLYVTWRPMSDLSIIAQYGLFTPNREAFTADEKRAYFSTAVIVYF